MKARLRLLALIGALLAAAACAPGPNPQVHTRNAQGVVAGFWRGLWHGVIAPVTFVVSLFSARVQVYEVHNDGGWYNFGFLLGLSGSLGSAGRSSKR